MKLYLAGPMRGYPEFNFPAFHEAAVQLRAAGYEVVSPAEADLNDGFDTATGQGIKSLREYMKLDLPAVLDADAVAVLPGWQNSTGASLEVHVARVCEIPVHPVRTLLKDAA